MSSRPLGSSWAIGIGGDCLTTTAGSAGVRRVGWLLLLIALAVAQLKSKLLTLPLDSLRCDQPRPVHPPRRNNIQMRPDIRRKNRAFVIAWKPVGIEMRRFVHAIAHASFQGVASWTAPTSTTRPSSGALAARLAGRCYASYDNALFLYGIRSCAKSALV